MSDFIFWLLAHLHNTARGKFEERKRQKNNWRRKIQTSFERKRLRYNQKVFSEE
jgi:hypothetical protein